MQGLSVSRVVDVQVSFAPQAAVATRFDTLLIMGDSAIIDSGEAIREYNRISDVAADYGTTAPEYYWLRSFSFRKSRHRRSSISARGPGRRPKGA